MATLLLAAHAIRLGAGPVSSFSRAAVGAVLRLPEGWVPEIIVCLGHPAPRRAAADVPATSPDLARPDHLGTARGRSVTP